MAEGVRMDRMNDMYFPEVPCRDVPTSGARSSTSPSTGWLPMTASIGLLVARETMLLMCGEWADNVRWEMEGDGLFDFCSRMIENSL